MMAHFSNDIGLIDAFKNSIDVHSKTASLVYNVPIELVQPEMRRTAKGCQLWNNVWSWCI